MNRDAGNINFFARYEFQMTGYEISPGKACTNCNFINDSPATANDELNTTEQALNEQVAGEGAVLLKHADGYLPTPSSQFCSLPVDAGFYPVGNV